jgi:hypothetical protein
VKVLTSPDGEAPRWGCRIYGPALASPSVLHSSSMHHSSIIYSSAIILLASSNHPANRP